METQELKCASCGETFDPKDSPYEGSLHLKKCEKCFHLGMQRDALGNGVTDLLQPIILQC